MTETTPVKVLSTEMNQGLQIFFADHKEQNYFTFKVMRSFQIRIYTPLVTLKIGLLLWFAASSSAVTFLIVYLRQIGLTIQEIFVIHTITPALQVLGSTMLSVMVDKFGHSKLILICNLLLSGASVIAILFVPPPLSSDSCQSQNINFYCLKENMTWISEKRTYSLSNNDRTNYSCEIVPLKTFIQPCNDSSIACYSDTESDSIVAPLSVTPEDYQRNVSSCFDFLPLNWHPNVSNYMCNDSWNEACHMSCVMENDCQDDTANRNLIIVIYNVILFVILATYMTIFRFFDITAVQLVKEHNVDYGRLRVWASLGYLAGPLVAGLLVQFSSDSSTRPNYDAFMYFYSVLCFIAALVVFKVDIRGFNPGKKMWKKSIRLLRSPDVSIFYVVLFLTGTSWGFDGTYKNWFLAEIGTEAYMFGIVNSCQSAYVLPFLLKSKFFVNKLGDTNMFVMVLVGYSLKFVSYSFLRTAWPALLIEVITALTYQLHWVAVIQYCMRITPVGLSATVNCVSGSIHYTIGRISGAFIGGVLLSIFDKRTVFQLMAGSNLCVAVLYGCYLYFRRK